MSWAVTFSSVWAVLSPCLIYVYLSCSLIHCLACCRLAFCRICKNLYVFNDFRSLERPLCAPNPATELSNSVQCCAAEVLIVEYAKSHVFFMILVLYSASQVLPIPSRELSRSLLFHWYGRCYLKVRVGFTSVSISPTSAHAAGTLLSTFVVQTLLHTSFLKVYITFCVKRDRHMQR